MRDLDEAAARVAHEVNRAYCAALGDHSQLPWDQAPQWQKDSAIAGIQLHWKALVQGREPRPEESHESWLAHKVADGWKYGPEKKPEIKEHPCMVPYAQLPKEQQAKDALFIAVARSLWEALLADDATN